MAVPIWNMSTDFHVSSSFMKLSNHLKFPNNFLLLLQLTVHVSNSSIYYVEVQKTGIYIVLVWLGLYGTESVGLLYLILPLEHTYIFVSTRVFTYVCMYVLHSTWGRENRYLIGVNLDGSVESMNSVHAVYFIFFLPILAPQCIFAIDIPEMILYILRVFIT